MIRVDIESIVMASGPIPSVIVLRERKGASQIDAPLRALSIQTGAYEAASIGHGADTDKPAPRPIAHDLLLNTVKELGAKIERVEISRWSAPIFYADVILKHIDETETDRQNRANGKTCEIRIDARPSDALALATRANVPIYVEDDVMNRAGSVTPTSSCENLSDQTEIERFDEFVKGLSPDDF